MALGVAIREAFPAARIAAAKGAVLIPGLATIVTVTEGLTGHMADVWTAEQHYGASSAARRYD